MVHQRAERDLDDHLAAVLAPRDELGLAAHRARTRRAVERPAVFGVARAHRVGNERLDLEADELVALVAEQRRGRRIGERRCGRCGR